MEVCPQGTYLNTTSRQCVPCHEACQGGCAGPLPYVNRTHGCLECDRVQLDEEGRQVREGGEGGGALVLETNILAFNLKLPFSPPLSPSPLSSSLPPLSPPLSPSLSPSLSPPLSPSPLSSPISSPLSFPFSFPLSSSRT